MGKYALIGLVVIVILGGLLYFIPAPTQNIEPAQETSTTTPNDGQICIQVVTPARNPETGQIKEYPTPCDVPDGWEVIVNEEPGL